MGWVGVDLDVGLKQLKVIMYGKIKITQYASIFLENALIIFQAVRRKENIFKAYV